MEGPSAPYVSLENLRSMVGSINRLLAILLSHEAFSINELEIEAARQGTLDGKFQVLTRVTGSLESVDSMEHFERLLDEVERAGFRASYGIKIELKVYLPNVPMEQGAQKK